MDVGHRIFEDFNRIYDSLTQVDEVGTILNEKEEVNQSPIQLEGKCIGLQMWCIKPLFLHAYTRLLEHVKQNEIEKPEYVMRFTRCVLLLCSDCTTAWNMRKQVLATCCSKDTLKAELHLAKLCLKRHPKSTESFAHRRWTLLRISYRDPHVVHSYFGTKKKCETCKKLLISYTPVSDNFASFDLELIRNEMKVCENIANCHASNYNAWSHRSWVINTYILPTVLTQTPLELQTESISFLMSELQHSRNWIELNVSDHSGISYCQQILRLITIVGLLQNDKVCSCCKNKSKLPKSGQTEISIEDISSFWTETVNFCNDLFRLHGPNHEALWMCKYGLIVLFHNLLENAFVNVSLSRKGNELFCDEIEKLYPNNSHTLLKNHQVLTRRYFEQC